MSEGHRLRRPVSTVMLVLTVVTLFTLGPALGQSESSPTAGRLGDVSDGSRAGAVHHVGLYTEDGFPIFPGVNSEKPFSTFVTCGQCHLYETIQMGWHFNPVADSNDMRTGEPWIYWDCATATQIPLSLRAWPGTFDPNDIGLTDWWFTRTFGRHMLGGGPGVQNPDEALDPDDRWAASGDLQVNCLSCHDAEVFHDQAAYAQQVGKHNYRWAATATSSFAVVDGAAKKLPDFWEKGDPSEDLPQVQYDETRFFAKNKVFLDLRKDVSNKRCAFCHSTKVIDEGHHGGPVDVHMAAGMKCVDCHRHGLDHQMSRGYETEAADTNDISVAGLSCAGCHLGEEDAHKPTAGNLTAPVPLHKGIPTIHFEKMSCTACHSGPWPEAATYQAKTSRAHALGAQGANRSDETLPHIQMPVFAPGHDGKLAPHKLVWPAYWGRLSQEQVTPLAIDRVQDVFRTELKNQFDLENASWPKLTEQDIQTILKALGTQVGPDAQPVYVSGGKLYSLTGGSVNATEHEAGKPYLWPIAHEVRPAAQSLGVRKCQDCHDTEAPILFGEVAVDGALADPNASVSMIEFAQLDPGFSKLFAQTFVFRPMLKVVALIACAAIGLVILWAVLRVLDALIRGSLPEKE